MPPGAGTTYTVTINPTGGFSGSVTLSLSGQLAGIGGSFIPNPTSSTSTLTVTTSPTTSPGTYTLTITGAGGTPTVSHTTTVTLVVQAATAGDFSLSATPSSQNVRQGATKAYTVNIARTGGFAGDVTFTIIGLPAGTTGSFDPNPAGTNSSTLTVAVGAGTATGSYVLTITGASGPLRHTASVTLVVKK